MPSKLSATSARMLALAGFAGLAALLSNALQPPSRHLAWSGFRPPSPISPPGNVAPPEPPVPAKAPTLPLSPTPPIRPAALPIPRPGVEAAPPPAAPSSPIQEITSQEAWKAFQAGLPFLDARRSVDYAAGHVAGAWCSPVWESDLEDRLLAFKAARRPGPEDPIVIYCSGGDCRDSHLLAERLLGEGYFHLLIYRDGFPDWVAQKHPVEKGQP
ncbi:MAG: rhodanese-like domain-containing protein [Geothrix sp.]|uniref:rhodanese-like domain-containing protein n=1 Tax=Geothrix sp. TaxID=1962974 RepID=UPI001800D290|nr:rhodanese-like domain-containing protein [Geothrix sp.]NWJ39515.1 rhodanese-like domain-containing protein [Geothrix sp.]WIL19264.1 MAG: rhodanese-like domain-containing protein [Geothrix sp.]